MADILDKDGRPVKRTVLDADDIMDLAAPLQGHRKLVERLMHWLEVDRVNEVHSKYFDTPGPAFVKSLLEDFDVKLRVDNEEVLASFPEGTPFITVSNHPFGALDGIALIKLVTTYRPEYKVMVNMILNHISAMRPNFIAVDALASDDPAKKAVSMRGIKEAIMQVRRGRPMGFFPAGAVSKLNGRFRLEDREWQPTIVRLIRQLDVPVVPIFFHGSNSAMFNILGVLSWQLRTLRLPSEVFRKCHSTLHISVGEPISVEEQKLHQGSDEEFGKFLKDRTYALRKLK
ncbi:MAG: 1-acyl-sn-glycerol-3-phosphate acyltransferase [Muribaculaceae bacterium]|nr:1-acyl-sn-glycerol-3-phosphate acyltransferase [Muribaculaceae bacterium]